MNRDLSLGMATLRLIYTAVMFVSLGALALLQPEAYVHGQDIAYIFFIAHILLLGYLAYVSGYVHWFLGAFFLPILLGSALIDIVRLETKWHPAMKIASYIVIVLGSFFCLITIFMLSEVFQII